MGAGERQAHLKSAINMHFHISEKGNVQNVDFVIYYCQIGHINYYQLRYMLCIINKNVTSFFSVFSSLLRFREPRTLQKNPQILR